MTKCGVGFTILDQFLKQDHKSYKAHDFLRLYIKLIKNGVEHTIFDQFLKQDHKSYKPHDFR